MTFLALLTKELRLRMRRERTVWVIVLYILFMGLLGWLTITTTSSTNGTYAMSYAGTNLYGMLAQLQLFLILFIAPAFTATVVNGEKERQTFDLLLCSRLSAFSLVSAKLLAGLTNAFLLIAASIPLFSLVFFFGGVSPVQLLQALLVYLITAITVGTFGLLCSTLLYRPAMSTAITYMGILLWVIVPWILTFIDTITRTTRMVPQTGTIIRGTAPQSQLPAPSGWLIFNPEQALNTTYSLGSSVGNYTFLGLSLPSWAAYALIGIIVTILIFLLSVWTVKPYPIARLRTKIKKTIKNRLHSKPEIAV
jgi:ABC-type transport system involved in multi-copper enzyme maturation permease subunit